MSRNNWNYVILTLILLVLSIQRVLAQTCSSLYHFSSPSSISPPDMTLKSVTWPVNPDIDTFYFNLFSDFISDDTALPYDHVRNVEVYLTNTATFPNASEIADLSPMCKENFPGVTVTAWTRQAMNNAAPDGDMYITNDPNCGVEYTFTGNNTRGNSSKAQSYLNVVRNCPWSTTGSNITHHYANTTIWVRWTDTDSVNAFTRTSSKGFALSNTVVRTGSNTFDTTSFRITEYGFTRLEDSDNITMTIGYSIGLSYPFVAILPANPATALILPPGWSEAAKQGFLNTSQIAVNTTHSCVNGATAGTLCTQTGIIRYTYNMRHQCDPFGMYAINLRVSCFGTSAESEACTQIIGQLAPNQTFLTVGAGLNLCADASTAYAVTVAEPLRQVDSQGNVLNTTKLDSWGQALQVFSVGYALNFGSRLTALKQIYDAKLWTARVTQVLSSPANATQQAAAPYWDLVVDGVEQPFAQNVSFVFSRTISNPPTSAVPTVNISMRYTPNIGPNRQSAMIIPTDWGKEVVLRLEVTIRFMWDSYQSYALKKRDSGLVWEPQETIGSPRGEIIKMFYDARLDSPASHFAISEQGSFSARNQGAPDAVILSAWNDLLEQEKARELYESASASQQALQQQTNVVIGTTAIVGTVFLGLGIMFGIMYSQKRGPVEAGELLNPKNALAFDDANGHSRAGSAHALLSK